MKILFIVIAMLFTMTSLASDIKAKKSVDDLFESFEQKQITNKSAIELENENISLKIELRDFRRRYYAAKNEVTKLQKEVENHRRGESTVKTYTKEQVRSYIARAQNETWLEGILYSTGERQFLATLSPADYQWFSAVLLGKDIERIETFMGEKDYKTKLSKIFADYESYFHAKQKKETVTQSQSN